MSNYKIEKANEIYSKIQGALWAKEKCEEYEHYERCKEISKTISKLYKDLMDLNLTEEEKEKTGYEFVNYEMANKWFYSLR